MTDEFIFKKLNKKYPRPQDVQKFLRTFPYNREQKGETQRSAWGALQAKTLHCLEAGLVAAAILEHSGYPPLLMSLESQDDLDHVIYVFKEKSGWGSLGRSRMEGLHGRKPVFRSARDLAASYHDCFIDDTGRVTGFGIANLNDIKTPWRMSPRNVWRVEDYLIELPHKSLGISMSRYKKWFDYFKKTGQSGIRQKSWW